MVSPSGAAKLLIPGGSDAGSAPSATSANSTQPSPHSSVQHEGKPEICYFFGKEFRGKGIATAALSQLLMEITQRPLYAAMAGDNVGSRRVLEKCGSTVVEKKRSFAKARGEEIGELILTLE